MVTDFLHWQFDSRTDSQDQDVYFVETCIVYFKQIVISVVKMTFIFDGTYCI